MRKMGKHNIHPIATSVQRLAMRCLPFAGSAPAIAAFDSGIVLLATRQRHDLTIAKTGGQATPPGKNSSTTGWIGGVDGPSLLSSSTPARQHRTYGKPGASRIYYRGTHGGGASVPARATPSLWACSELRLPGAGFAGDWGATGAAGARPSAPAWGAAARTKVLGLRVAGRFPSWFPPGSENRLSRGVMVSMAGSSRRLD
jgi:hypothetical protein